MRLAILTLTILLSLPAMAADKPTAAAASPTPLTFNAWKQQQVLSAQNQVLRLGALIRQIKSGKVQPNGDKNPKMQAFNSRIKSTGEDPLALAEKDLIRAQESLQTANGLQIDDYITIYLPTLQGHPEAVDKLAGQLSKEELVELFKGLVQKGGANSFVAPHHTAALFDGMALSNAPNER